MAEFDQLNEVGPFTEDKKEKGEHQEEARWGMKRRVKMGRTQVMELV